MRRIDVCWRPPMLEPAPSRSATMVGFGAVLLWSSLASLTVACGPIPPFELTALTFAVGGVLGLSVALARGRGRRCWLWPSFQVLCLGITGLFGDYVLYFGALQLAPPAHAMLIVDLWPLFMVLLATLILHERLRFAHMLGAGLGLAGVIVLTMSTAASMEFELRYVPGYLMALGAAVVWAGYSVLSRRHADVPTETIASVCLVAAVLAGLGHAALERTVLPADPHQILAVVALGLGPAGGAFFLWDHGVKRGSVRVLAILGYATPVVSMIMLVGLGYTAPTVSLAVACGLIVLAGLLATNAPNWRLPRVKAARPPGLPAES